MKRLLSAIFAIVLLLSSFSAYTIFASATTYSPTIKTGTYATIKNVGSGKMLNVYGSRSANNTNITVYAKDNTSGQDVRAYSANGGYYFTFRCSTSRALNIYGTSCKESANVCIWDITKNPTQIWIIEYVPSKDAYILRSKSNSSYCLTANGSSNSSNVCIKKYTGSTYQLWTSSLFNKNASNTSTTTTKSSSSSITTAKIQSVLNKYGYSTGKYWTTYDSPCSGSSDCGKTTYTIKSDLYATNKPATKSSSKSYKSYNFNSSWQCHGFALYVMSKVSGVTVSSSGGNGWKKYSSVSSLKVGDIIRITYKAKSGGHTAVVLSVSGSECKFAECWGGVNSKINIGKFNGKCSTLSDIKNNYNLSYVLRYEG